MSEMGRVKKQPSCPMSLRKDAYRKLCDGSIRDPSTNPLGKPLGYQFRHSQPTLRKKKIVICKFCSLCIVEVFYLDRKYKLVSGSRYIQKPVYEPYWREGESCSFQACCHGDENIGAPVSSRTIRRPLAEGHLGCAALDTHPSTPPFGVVPHTRKLDCSGMEPGRL
ncbi:hypothetical protein TNCV_1779711 [Trichonephila clavipes]|nr:hypothetical protein TNCV_1779711 [Trichonephila clavipes]